MGIPYSADQQRLFIRQIICDANKSNNQPNVSDKEKEVLSYLENLPSICYPNGLSIGKLQIKSPLFQRPNSSPSHRKNQLQLIDTDCLEEMKQHKISHYTITTSLAVKRYISFLNCYEPIQKQLPVQGSQANLLPNAEYLLHPFSFVLVQDVPAFTFGKQILKGIFETTLTPYYQMLCSTDSATNRN